MQTLPAAMIQLLAPFAPLFSERVWRYTQVLLTGAILAPGERIVSAALRAAGLGDARRFERYHRVLNRAAWPNQEASRVLLGLLVKTFLADEGEPLAVGVDETHERRWGAEIAKGIHWDPVRSSHGHFVKASGLRWVCLMLLVPVACWASRTWALPLLSVLAPSERYAQEWGKKKPHKKMTHWARRMLLLVRRWWPEREIVAAADSGYAAIALLNRYRRFLPKKPVTFVMRLRLDAALYEPAPPRKPGQMRRTRYKGKRLPTSAVVMYDPSTTWASFAVAKWYSGGERTVEMASATALWYHMRLPPVPLRPT